MSQTTIQFLLILTLKKYHNQQKKKTAIQENQHDQTIPTVYQRKDQLSQAYPSTISKIDSQVYLLIAVIQQSIKYFRQVARICKCTVLVLIVSAKKLKYKLDIYIRFTKESRQKKRKRNILKQDSSKKL